MIISKVTKNQGFTPFIENLISKKPAHFPQKNFILIWQAASNLEYLFCQGR